MFPYLEVTTREGIGMNRIAIALAMAEAGLTNFTGGVSK